MLKLAIVAIKLLTSGGCDKKGHGDDNSGASEPVPHFTELIHDDVELGINGVAHREEELTRFDRCRWRFARSNSLRTASISLIQQSSSSLNARFLPRPYLDTRAVLICDDDVEVDKKSVEFALSMWKSNHDRLIGTLLSNLAYYLEHGFVLEVFDHTKFDKWVRKVAASAIAPNLELYEKVQDLGYKVILLTGRRENDTVITIKNLINAGFNNWDELILRSWILACVPTLSLAPVEADPEGNPLNKSPVLLTYPELIDAAVIPFKLIANVKDDSGKANFLLFDTNAQMINEDPEFLPEAVSDLFGKRMLFEISVDSDNIRGKNSQYVVRRANDDHEMIEEFAALPPKPVLMLLASEDISDGSGGSSATPVSKKKQRRARQ
ncbi:hypothetical protein F2Q70_00017083 [Brassica cretica]|uniref:Glycosyl transferase 64 domain-containing protein n=1 Tax=Brassica cretica TaxID=69181 RepID=A0A8S9I3S5_BRACR|nr:hypothetical protein F2Q70_00017083 [Brassica cretica]KAF2599691.1 hypothetical protein F2Q68_00010034 [Brassica cretica]